MYPDNILFISKHRPLAQNNNYKIIVSLSLLAFAISLCIILSQICTPKTTKKPRKERRTDYSHFIYFNVNKKIFSLFFLFFSPN